MGFVWPGDHKSIVTMSYSYFPILALEGLGRHKDCEKSSWLSLLNFVRQASAQDTWHQRSCGTSVGNAQQMLEH